MACRGNQPRRSEHNPAKKQHNRRESAAEDEEMADKPAKKKKADMLEEEYRYKEYDAEIIGRLFSYLRPYAWWVVAAAAIMAITALVTLSRLG